MPLQNLKKGTHSIYGEKLDWTYYDQISLISTSTSYKLFAQAEGQGTPAKTLNQTNMNANGQIPTGQRLTISRLKIMYLGIAAGSAPLANIIHFYNFLANSVLRFYITGKDALLSITLQELLGAATLIPEVPAGTFNIPIIQPHFHGIFPLNKKIVLAEQTQFHVDIDCYASTPNAALNTDTVRIGLNGILERRS